MLKNSLQMSALTELEIRQAAPQAFAATPKPGVSNKYSYQRLVSSKIWIV